MGKLCLNYCRWQYNLRNIAAANLRQELEYSADNGDTWMPVAANIPSTLTSYALDTNLLPKSMQGKLRLWVTDGLNNITADSAGSITVPNHPPFAEILAPATNGYIPTSSRTLLQGQAMNVDEATDLPDRLPPN